MNVHNAMECIKAVHLHPKALNVFIDTIVKQLAISGKDISHEEHKEKMRSIFISNDFLKPFAENLNNFFTEEEITSLLGIYQSSLMKKMIKHADELFSPLYEAMRKQAEKL
ncbi:MAG: hypothetical protein LBC45_04720 [Chlamydiales bacterium]|jgi:hypothetical protein|nr:hypothetical protein [Chlamydiales bacterium]